MILSAQTIRKRCGAPDPMREWKSHYQPPTIYHPPLIAPFHERTISNGMSFGISSHGYDVRIAESVRLSHGGFKLASTIELFEMPDDLCALVKDKSSWARQGLCVQNTVIEAGWRGHLTLELTMHARGEIYIGAGMPIAQIIFHLLDQPTEQPYRGKYQDQEAGPQGARFD